MVKQNKRGLTLVATGLLLLATGCGRWIEKATGGGGGSEATDPGPQGPTGLDLTGFDLTLNTYESCDVLQQDVHDQLQAQADNAKAAQDYYAAQRNESKSGATAPVSASVGTVSDDAASEGGGSDGSQEKSITNVQEKGVDEADFVKLGTDHLYVAHASKIEVLDRASLASLGQIDVTTLSNVTLYAEAERLIVIGALASTDGKPTTSLRTYTAVKGAVPTLANERTYADQYSDSRFIDGKAILLFNSQLPLTTDRAYDYGYYGYSDRAYDLQDAAVPASPVVVADGKAGGVACTSISKPYIKDGDFRMTKVVVVNTRALADADQATAVLGGGDQVYMTTTGLYLAKQGVRWNPWVSPASLPPSGPELDEYWRKQNSLQETLVVTRIAYASETGVVAPTAVGAVTGRVKDQWAFKEYAEQGALAIATTTWAKFKPETMTEGQHNQLWILKQEDKTLALKAAVNDFGPKEDIRAARYLGSMAYIVTFEKTDPLFAFDLSDPFAPKLLSELKIPGFSMYLHPTSDGRLIGVGYDADDQGDFSWFQGIQVSLFDISNPLAMTRLDAQVIGDRGSYSDVTGDHKAFYEDKEHHLIGVPVVEKKKAEGSATGGSEQARDVTFTGAIVYDLAADKLTEKARLSHADLISPSCSASNDYHWWQDERRSLDINRLYTIDGRLITVSRFGVRAHDLDTPTTVLSTTQFAAEATDCQTTNNRWDY